MSGLISMFRRSLAAKKVALRLPSSRVFSNSSVKFVDDYEHPENAKTSDRHTTAWPTPDERKAAHKKTGDMMKVDDAFSLAGKTAILTGAARGLGNVMAKAFIESKAARIGIVDLSQSDADASAKELKMWAKAEHEIEVDVRGFACDVSKEDQVKSVMAKVKDWCSSIDVLVTSAGIVENIPALDYPADRLQLLMGINVNGTFFFAREAAKLMIESNNTSEYYRKGGSIILIGSMSGSIINIPQPQTPYNFSKAAIKHMARSLAIEWAQHGIRVNSVAPGYMATSLTKTILDKPENRALRDTWISRTPAGRLGDPQDLKGVAVFLASDASAFVTGTEIAVDGGYTAV